LKRNPAPTNDSLGPLKKCETIGVRLKFGDDLDHHASLLGIGMMLADLARFHKCQVPVHFFLKDPLVGRCLIPIEMIRNLQHDLSRWSDAHDVNGVWIIDSHHRSIAALRSGPVHLA
jgi:hypothetical protein